MDENGTALASDRRTWLKRAGIALGVLVLLLLAFHRPILLTVGRRLAIKFAAKENLRLDCRLEGSIFTNLVVRNLRIVPAGPTIVESIDADYIRADYSLLALWRNGASEFLDKVEVRNVTSVLDPAKASLKPKVPKPDRKITLPTIFPREVQIADVNLLVRSTAEARDFVLEHFDLDLNADAPGELQIGKLQIPSLPAWTNLSAQTTYADRNLSITGLNLDAENKIRLLGVDASRIKSKSIGLALDTSLAGGTFAGSIALTETGSSLDTKARFVADNISLDTLRGYIGRPPEFLSGNMDRLEVVWRGAIDAPRSWDGTVTARLSNLRKGNMELDRAALDLSAHGAVATITSAELAQGPNVVRLTGTASLPAGIREFGRAPASFQISGALPDLQALTASFPQKLGGAATLEGRADIVDATLRTAIQVSASSLSWEGGSAEGASASITASKQMPPVGSEKIYYADLRTDSTLEATNVRIGEYTIDAVHAKMQSADDLVTVEQASVVRAQNTAAVNGTYRLPIAFAKARLQPADISLSVEAPELATIWATDAENKISGPLQAHGQIALRDGIADGLVSIYGSNLRSGKLVVPELNSEVAISKNVVYLNDFTASLSESDYIRASGMISPDKPYRYSGSVSANVADLAMLKPILAAWGNNNEVAGSLVLDWRGSGEAMAFNNSGELKLNLENGRYANLLGLQARIDASYSPEGLNVPIVYFGSDKMLFQANAEAKGNSLEITNIQIDQGKAKYAAGYVSLPFVWRNIGSGRPVVDADGKVAVTFRSENLDIKKLTDDLGAPPVGSGLVSTKIDAEGTLANLSARLEMAARDLKSDKLPTLEPATFALTAEMQSNQLAFAGKLQQSRIQPVTITANLPLNLARIIEERKFDENTPVTGKLQLPRSSVNFLRQFAPGVEQLDGDVVLDVNVNGTVAKPVLSGTGEMTINVGRFSNPNLPVLRGLRSRLAFSGDTLTIERFAGDLAGGPFTLSGGLTFPKLTEPSFDLRLKAESALVARSDDLTARADADIRVVGPFASANVTGTVALTNSQFLKNIDLIPIALPGRPPPRPEPPSASAMLSFPYPPLRDWKFDVVVKTKDPFRLRGNLANGGALVDLKLVGTGLNPGLSGIVRLENVEATLPFSRLKIDYGFLYFDPGDSLNPKIDLQGTSLLRDYTVHVYVYGTTKAPEAVFTSEPPLPQEDIISLLATGVTRQELLSGSNVLAGRAAMLLVQQLYRKVFKKGEATKSNSVFDRLQVDVGTVDPRTGQQSATARFKLNDNFQLVGDLGVGGDFRGQVKYLIRFR